MKIIKLVGIVFSIVVGIFVLVGFALPESYSVSRSKMMSHSPKEIYNTVQNFKTWSKWSPWILTDSTMKVSFGKVSAGKGAVMNWESAETGLGSQEIISVEANKRIEMRLVFGEKGESKSDWKFDQTPEGTMVTWSFGGNMGNDIIGRYVMLMMDQFMGTFFEKGLENLDQNVVVEKVESKEAVVDSTKSTL
jgi:ribosome-associated toxin RatA of RatAB toxin-antitoxin module